MTHTHTVKAQLGAPPTAVFRALTDPAQLTTWFAEHAEVSLADGRYEFWGRYTPDGKPGRQRLLAVDPDRLLAFAWQRGGEEHRVDITLAPHGDNGTELTVVES